MTSAPHNIDALEASLRGALHQGNLTLKPADLPNGFVRGYVNLHKAEKLLLAGVTITRDANRLEISGTAPADLMLPGMEPHFLRDVTLDIWFEHLTGREKLRSGYSVRQGALSIGAHKLPLSGQFVPARDARIALRADSVPSGIDISALKTFCADLLAEDLDHLVVPLLAGCEVTKYETDIYLRPHIQSVVRVEMSGGAHAWQPLPIPLLAFGDPVVLIEAQLPYEDGPNLPVSTALGVAADVTLAGTPFHVIVAHKADTIWSTVIRPGKGQDMPGIEDIISNSHDLSLQSHVDAAMQASGISAPHVNAVRISFDTATTSLVELTILGGITLYGAELQLLLNLAPTLSFSGRYEAIDGEPALSLSKVFDDILPHDTTFAGLDLHQMSFYLDPGAGIYCVSARVHSDWHVDIAHKTLVFQELGFEFTRTQNGVSVWATASFLFAGLDFRIGASHPGPGEGWRLEGALAQGTPIHLKPFLTSLFEFFALPQASPAPDIQISDLQVYYDTKSGDMGFSGTTDAPIEVPFIDGAGGHVHCHLDLHTRADEQTGKHRIEGALVGDLTIGAAEFTLRYELSQERHVFAAGWQALDDDHTLSLQDLFDAIGLNDAPDLPDGLDLSLSKVQLEYDAHSQTLKLVADSTSHGTAFFVASKTSVDGTPENHAKTGKWGFLFGVEFTGVARLSDIPKIGPPLHVADALSFTNLGLVVASQDFSSVSLPEPPAAQPNIPALQGFKGTRHFGAGQGLRLDKGVSFMGEIDLAAGGVGALKSVVPTSRLTVSAGFTPGVNEITLRAMMDGDVSLDTGEDSAVALKQSGVELIYKSGSVAFELFGVMSMHLQDKVLDLEPRMLISPEVIELMTDLEIEGGWDSPLGIEGLTLDELGFEMGIDILPAPGVNIGLMGACHIGDAAPKSDRFALVLELIEEVPNPLLLSFNLDEIDIKTAMSVFAPDVDTDDLPDFLTSFKATDVEFFWAEKDVPLPDGTLANPGFRLGGNIQMLEYSAHGRLVIDKISGIEGELQLGPIHVAHILSVTGHSEGIYRNEVQGKPAQLRIKPDAAQDAQMQRVEVVPPGGPAMAFRTAHGPYLSGTLIASFLDALHLEVEALVTASGFDFKLVYDLGGVVHAELDVSLGDGAFHLYSQFGVHLKADIGPVVILGADLGTLHLDTGFDLELDLHVSGDDVTLKIDGEFDFEGARLVFPTLHLSIAPKSLAELPGFLITHLIENAGEIFAALFAEIGHLFEEAGKALVELGEEIAEEVSEIAQAVEKEAEEIVTAVAQTVEHAVEAVEAEVEAIGAEIEEIGAAAVAEVSKIVDAAGEVVNEIGKDIAKVAREALHTIEAIGAEIAEELEVVAAAVAQFAKDAVAEAKAILDAVGREVKRILAEAERVAKAILAAATQIVHALEDEAKAIWNEVEHLAAEAERLLEDAAHAIEHAAEDVVDVLSKY